MRAITVLPETPNSLRLDDVPEPPVADGAVLVDTLALGICGTDREIVAGDYGEAPPGAERLILGHESLGRIREAPRGGVLAPGDLVVGIVRRPDPVPCSACASGEWDMCRNGRYTERGIKGRNGYGAERFRIEPEFAVKVDPALGMLAVLLEPTSVVAKAWDHVDRVRRLAGPTMQRVLVTGAGSIGLLAALMGLLREYDVHILDHNKTGPKPDITRALGASYHTDVDVIAEIEPDVVIECTGAISVVAEILSRVTPDCTVCLTSVTAPSKRDEFDIGLFNRVMVLNNGTVFGTVNANQSHYLMAADALARADKTWLNRLITRRVPLDDYAQALEHRRSDIKVVVDFGLA